MTKFYLSAAAVMVAFAVQADSVKVEWLSGNNDGVTAPSLNAVSNNAKIVASDVQVGAGLSISDSEVPNVKDIDGNNQNEVGGNFAKVYPTMDEGQPQSYDEAVAADSYLAFEVEALEPDYFYSSEVSMDLTGVGTDAYRMQVVLSGEGDEGEFSLPVLTPENCHEFAPDGGWMSNGWRPSRNDGTKSDKSETKADAEGNEVTYTSIQSTAGFTHLVIPTSKVASIATQGAYTFKVTVYMWGIASNKQYGIRNVIVTGSDDASGSGISGVAVDNVDENAPVYNVLGQKVDKNTKGLLIQNGRKFYNR